MTPRTLAARHLPELAESFDLLQQTFGARLVYLTTPEGTFGSRPDWADWPTVNLTEIGPPYLPPAEHVRRTRSPRR